MINRITERANPGQPGDAKPPVQRGFLLLDGCSKTGLGQRGCRSGQSTSLSCRGRLFLCLVWHPRWPNRPRAPRFGEGQVPRVVERCRPVTGGRSGKRWRAQIQRDRDGGKGGGWPAQRNRALWRHKGADDHQLRGQLSRNCTILRKSDTADPMRTCPDGRQECVTVG